MAKWKSIKKEEVTKVDPSEESSGRNKERSAATLQGSVKMIGWAERIRDAIFSIIETNKLANSEDEEISNKLTTAYNKLLLVDEASWWIDSKDTNPKDIIKFALTELDCEEGEEDNSLIDMSDL